MDEQRKRDTSTGSLPSIRTAKGRGGSRQSQLTPPSTLKVQRQFSNAPTLEGSKPTTGNNKAGLLALKILLGDLLEAGRHYPQSWVGSKNGSLYICIEPDTGRLAMVQGKLYFDGVLVDTILESEQK